MENFKETHDSFPRDIDHIDKIIAHHQCFRIFWWTSDARALEKGVNPTNVDIVNRWKAIEAALGNRPSQPMRQHYAQVELLMGPFLRYTFAM